MTPRLRLLVPAALLCLATSPASAQSARRLAAAARRAADGITATDVHDRIAVIADDSMRGRATPSPELDETAAWVAAQFQSFGLRPGGDSGTFFQRYPIRRVQTDSASFVMMMGRGVVGRWALGREAAAATALPPMDSAVTGPAVLLVGMPADTARPFGDVDVRGAVVVQHLRSANLRRETDLVALIARGAAAGVRAWLLLLDAPAQTLAFQMRRQLQPRYVVGASRSPVAIPTFFVRDSTAADVLRAAGEDLAALRDTSAHAVRAMDGFTVTVSAREQLLGEATAPNVLGVLEGSDPALKDEYVFFTGHMDHIGVVGGDEGCRAAGADSICNGADDDASGTVGVVELAEAFARMDPRPRRSLVFLTVSGEERGLWGSNWYVEHPEVPLERTVADLNTDMIGRYNNDQPGWRDTIAVIGKEQSSLGALADRIAAAHPELHMTLVGDIWPTENFYRRSDHFNFARKGVPILFFFNGTHSDYHRAGDEVAKIDAEKESRILKMIFYLGLEVANAPQPPQWDPAARQQVVEGSR